MSFFSRHYEKILLALLLLGFILSLVYLLKIITSTDQVTEKDLKIPEQRADYRVVDFTAPRFDFQKAFIDGSRWSGSTKRNKEDLVYTDLTMPFKCARCPHCKKIVPQYYFYNDPHKCPLCSKELPTPGQKGPKTKVDKAADSDSDSMPDLVEERFGLDRNDASDANQDLDKDGFTNIYEYKNKTSMGDPKSHPPLYQRLYVAKIHRTMLDILLKSIISAGPQKDWTAALKVRSGKRDSFNVLGDKIELRGKNNQRNYYLFEKFIFDEKNKPVGIMIKSQKNSTRIPVYIERPAFSPDIKVEIKDVIGNKEEKYILKEGETFIIGSRLTGREQLRLVLIDAEDIEVKVFDENSKKDVIITRELRIPRVAGLEESKPKSDSDERVNTSGRVKPEPGPRKSPKRIKRPSLGGVPKI